MSRPRKKATRGNTAMLHALAWARNRFGEARVQGAGKRIAWIPGGKGGGLRPISRGEDLWGVADLVCLRPGRPLLVQVTTQTKSRGSVWTRRVKAQKWLEQVGEHVCEFWVISWVRRQHFRRWVWRDESWTELEPFWSPDETKEALKPS